jgi:hypothetical protein
MIGQGISGGQTFGTSRDDLLREATKKRLAAAEAAKKGASAKSIGSGIGTALGVVGGGLVGGLQGAVTGGSIGATLGSAAGGMVEGEEPTGDLLQAGNVASSKRGKELLDQMMKAWG